MASRSAGLNVVITGDTRGLERATSGARRDMDKFGKEAEQHSSRVSKGFAGVGVAARGMALGFGAAVLVGDKLVSAFNESNKVAKQTEAVLKSTGGAAGVTAKQVGDLATAISRKTGIDDEAIQSGENLLLTFTNVHNEAGRGNQIFSRATQTLADMSAALGQDTKSSAIQLGKALNDPIKGVTALQRVGVSFTQSQRDQIKALVESGHAMDAQKVILRELNKEFGGSAAAQATPFAKLKVSAGNLAETLGGFLAPAFGKAADGANKFLIGLQDGTGAGGAFIRWVKGAAGTLQDAWGTAVAAVHRFVVRNREDIESVAAAMRNVGRAIRTVVERVIIPAVKILAPAVRDSLQGIVTVMRGVIRIFSGVLTGNWRKAWTGFKDIVVGSVRAIGSLMKGLDNVLGAAAKAAGKAIVSGILAGMGQLGHLITKKITDSIGFASNILSSPGGIPGGIGKAIGKAITGGIGDGIGKLGPTGGGKFGGSLMGARPSMAPVASIGSRFGLQVSSGRRPGSITSSGNVSYHSSGEALDEAGPASGMLRFFKYMKSTFGARLAELIYTPGGVGIKNGRPYRYGGQVAADHYDHVHVAVDTGAPGVGDGIGRVSGKVSTFGPPLEAAGTTASGASSSAPGIALYQRGTLGKLFRVRVGGHSAVLRQTDIGPAPWTGRKIDVTGAGARKLGFNPADFPTDTAGSATLVTKRSSKRGGAGNVRPGLSASNPGIGSVVGGGGFGAGVPGVSSNILSTGFGAGVGMFTPDPDFSLPTELDYLNAASAQAALTPGTADDLTAAQNSLTYSRGIYNQALGTKDPRIIGPAAEALRQAMDVVAGLKESIDASNRLAEERAQVTLELRDEQRAIRRLMETQGPQMLAGLAAFFSGDIGGRVGLGLQTPGFAGTAGSVRY